MAHILTVLRSGGDFLPEHVIRLRDMCPNDVTFTCLSDVPIDGVEVIPLVSSWPGYWAKFELFRPDVPRGLYMDLDTDITGDIDSLLSVTGTHALNDFYMPAILGSGLMYIDDDLAAETWASWTDNPSHWMSLPQRRTNWGDQGVMQKIWAGRETRWQNVLPKNTVVSYKYHRHHGMPKEASVICYHGKPRPWDVGKKSNRRPV